MTTQAEQVLENELVKQLVALGHTFVSIKDEAQLLANLKTQLEKHNNTKFTSKEFDQILNHLNKGSVFERAKLLRDRFCVIKEDNSKEYIQFLNQDHWCQNEFQVSQQIAIDGVYKNRYDVTLLINGLPLVQIELKRRGLELKEAFNQINRYQRHSYGASQGLFNYVQIFVISNGVNTRYYANNRKQDPKQTFSWADVSNNRINTLDDFTKNFLEPCHVSKMIAKYIVLSESYKTLMILRPYQYYAAEAIIERVKNGNKNGYIWHTTGSGKTLTSFKAAQVIMHLPKVHKVVFVVDRQDLDYQTITEFNSFSKGSVEGTEDTNSLVQQFSDDTKLIVTTIQKLNTAIQKARHSKKMEKLQNEKIVFIFDECHRSQFGETHKRICTFFKNAQLFGFTGTPIFAENAMSNELGIRTTTDLFDEILHKYVITDAINDQNVLKFSIEYVGRYKYKEGSKANLDIEVEDIDTAELMESTHRLDKISNYIIANHDRKTHNKNFSAILCVSSIEALIKYYELFKQKKAEGLHDLRIASIFSYSANEEDKSANGLLESEDNLLIAAETSPIYSHSREKLDTIVTDYNKQYKTSFSLRDNESFGNYKKDISKKIKDREREDFNEDNRIDVLLVVNMFLTGFDAKKVNTLYTDKNLKYHGLIQAYSRTNRILNEQKSQGNIVSFRNLKKATDDAIALFSNKEAKEIIIMQPYEDYVAKFNAAFKLLLDLTPTVKSVDKLISEDDQLEFIKRFRELMRIKNVLTTFVDFNWDDLSMTEQQFNDYKSKYLDLYQKVKFDHQKVKVSILNDVDFELELIHRDEINVAYILKLLGRLKLLKKDEQERQREAILGLLSGEVQLRSKKELIERFILENIPMIDKTEDIPEEFDKFMFKERIKAFHKICSDEQVVPEKLQMIIDNYLFTERIPLRDDIIAILVSPPSILERKTIAERIIMKIVQFVQTFIDGMPSVA